MNVEYLCSLQPFLISKSYCKTALFSSSSDAVFEGLNHLYLQVCDVSTKQKLKPSLLYRISDGGEREVRQGWSAGAGGGGGGPRGQHPDHAAQAELHHAGQQQPEQQLRPGRRRLLAGGGGGRGDEMAERKRKFSETQ